MRASSHVLYLLSVVESTEPKQVHGGKLVFVSERTIKDIIILDHLVPWEEVFTDSSGKFRRKSKHGNNYFTVFVCAKTGDKIAIPHVKRKHFPLVYFEFSKRIGRHPTEWLRRPFKTLVI